MSKSLYPPAEHSGGVPLAVALLPPHTMAHFMVWLRGPSPKLVQISANQSLCTEWSGASATFTFSGSAAAGMGVAGAAGAETVIPARFG